MNVPDLGVFSERWTYLFEIIYPENRIVVDYGTRAELVLLAIRDTNTGEEGDVAIEASRLRLTPARRFTIATLADLDALLAGMDGVREEGFVCRFSNGLRAKFKCEDYRRLHRIITGVSAKSIWEALSTVGTIEEVTRSAPADFTAWATGIAAKLTVQHDALVVSARKVSDAARGLPTRKEQAAVILEQAPELSGIVFSLLDGQDERASGRAWKLCKPERAELFRKDIDAT
jgi:RNA ligase